MLFVQIISKELSYKQLTKPTSIIIKEVANPSTGSGLFSTLFKFILLLQPNKLSWREFQGDEF